MSLDVSLSLFFFNDYKAWPEWFNSIPVVGLKLKALTKLSQAHDLCSFSCLHQLWQEQIFFLPTFYFWSHHTAPCPEGMEQRSDGVSQEEQWLTEFGGEGQASSWVIAGRGKQMLVVPRQKWTTRFSSSSTVCTRHCTQTCPMFEAQHCWVSQISAE